MESNMFLQKRHSTCDRSAGDGLHVGFWQIFSMLPLSTQSNELKIYNSNWIGPDQKYVGGKNTEQSILSPAY